MKWPKWIVPVFVHAGCTPWLQPWDVKLAGAIKPKFEALRDESALTKYEHTIRTLGLRKQEVREEFVRNLQTCMVHFAAKVDMIRDAWAECGLERVFDETVQERARGMEKSYLFDYDGCHALGVAQSQNADRQKRTRPCIIPPPPQPSAALLEIYRQHCQQPNSVAVAPLTNDEQQDFEQDPFGWEPEEQSDCTSESFTEGSEEDSEEQHTVFNGSTQTNMPEDSQRSTSNLAQQVNEQMLLSDFSLYESQTVLQREGRCCLPGTESELRTPPPEEPQPQEPPRASRRYVPPLAPPSIRVGLTRFST